MVEQKQAAELLLVDIQRKIDEWLSKGGEDQLIRALQKADQDSKILRNEARVDPKVLNEPVTV